MDSPYRSARTPTQERREALRRELEAAEERVVSLAHAIEQRDTLAGELERLDREARQESQRHTPRLRSLKVAAPCSARWEDMVGDQTKRFCGGCLKNVYDLSAMSAEAAEALLDAGSDDPPCVRFTRRADGTVLSGNCSVGAVRRGLERAVVSALGLGVGAAAAIHLTLGEPTHLSTPQRVGKSYEEATTPLDPRRPPSIDRANEGWTMGVVAPTRHPTEKPKSPHSCPPGDPLCSG